ncbi:uncharacterized protein LOC121256267 [Juglans microcarpa x Juglans regia]|uniref:uncharacterized protein LOC121256267 n=1 Tax=Juglans microcarpa x Juglans regia TaxID=2249226 RepID=UPI001B7DA842|nr:uncharacterized protein LOC121256267 [Juglans microcarpa x Juglans regia]
MIRVATDDGSRRHLPLWMLGVTAANENNNHAPEGLMPQAYHSESKTVTKGPDNGNLFQEKGTSGVNSHSFVKCERKRKRKSSQQEAKCDDIITETVSEKKKYKSRRKVQASIACKRQKEKASDFGRDEEFENQPQTDDDVELIMDDLMTIAEEYVEAEKNKDWQASNSEYGSRRKVPMKLSSSNDSGGLLDVPNSNRGSPPHDLTAFDSCNVTGASEIDMRTGDPAQDMLDLFLGPLLKKSLKEENKPFVKDMQFAYEFERLNQNNVLGEQAEPLMKKKSSLSEKVAKFLD